MGRVTQIKAAIHLAIFSLLGGSFVASLLWMTPLLLWMTPFDAAADPKFPFFQQASFSLTRVERDKTENRLSRMTPEEKIGQLLMVGIRGKRLTPGTERLIKKLKLGGVIFYAHNIDDPVQLRQFTSAIQHVASLDHRIPLFISVDQEGGSVARIRKGVYSFPPPMAIGATGSLQLSYMVGKMMALDLSAMGINMNLAPVLDVNTEQENQLIGIRSFGGDPELVAQMGMWYIEGLQSRGVVATAKHFPGHGNTAVDSHYAIPAIQTGLSDLEKFHLLPFKKAMENGLDALMTAHLSVPAIDPSGLPATFSYNLLTEVVRKKMNYQGLIVTDDLEMKSIRNRYGVGEAALKAILAGSDVVMVSWTDEKKTEVFNALLTAYREGKLTEERLNESVRRILKLKYQRGFFDAVREPASLNPKWLTHSAHQKLLSQIAAKAITMVFNKGVLPLKEEDPRKVLLATPFNLFYEELKFYHEDLSSLKIPNRPTISEIETIVSNITELKNEIDLLMIGLTHRSQLPLVQRLSQNIKKPIVVISFESPYLIHEIKKISEISAFLCSYGTQPELVRATAESLVGIIHPTGKSPVLSMETASINK
ncbi:MAG: beta-N-acetylhexosaminidase [Deltaproteobacteria bacterium]